MGFGPRGAAVSVGAGEAIEGQAARVSPHLPEGVKADLVFDLNLGVAVELALEAMAFGAPEEADLLEALSEIFALDELAIHSASGIGSDFRHEVTYAPNYGAALRSRGLIPEQGIQRKHLRAVPKDALWADVVRLDWGAAIEMVLAAAADPLADIGIEDPIEYVTQLTGIHIERDLLDHLGSTFGLYASDTTGGGGLASMVAFLEVTDADGLRPLVERMQSLVNGIGLAEADGYVQVRRWENNGIACLSLTFPGLPIPIELSMALTEDLLVIGATPRALVTALEQARGTSPNLLDNEHFQASAALDPIGSYRVTFFDTPRAVRDGYGFVSLVTSALANATRSRRDESRDAGIIMPSFHDLMKGAVAWTQITQVDTEDLLIRTRSDPSVLTTASQIAGVYSANALPLVAALATFGFAQESGLGQAGTPLRLEDW